MQSQRNRSEGKGRGSEEGQVGLKLDITELSQLHRKCSQLLSLGKEPQQLEDTTGSKPLGEEAKAQTRSGAFFQCTFSSLLYLFGQK